MIPYGPPLGSQGAFPEVYAIIGRSHDFHFTHKDSVDSVELSVFRDQIDGFIRGLKGPSVDLNLDRFILTLEK